MRYGGSLMSSRNRIAPSVCISYDVPIVWHTSDKQPPVNTPSALPDLSALIPRTSNRPGGAVAPRIRTNESLVVGDEYFPKLGLTIGPWNVTNPHCERNTCSNSVTSL